MHVAAFVVVCCIYCCFVNAFKKRITDNPQRLNGKVSGSINGISFDNLDMHGFVQTKEGRAYTAINRVPETVSSAMMTLNTIGGLIGWLFAKRGGPGAKNGYMYTGVLQIYIHVFLILAVRPSVCLILTRGRVYGM